MTGKIAAALALFQAEMPVVGKTHTAEVTMKSGGKFSYTYADLADITEAAMPLLTRHGLAFSACPRSTERGYELAGRLLHDSGEALEGALPIAGNTAQELGSSITYMRRYLFGCMTGLVTDDDDDGRLASKPPPARKRAATTGPQAVGGGMASTPAPPPTESTERVATKSRENLGDLLLDPRGKLAKAMFAAFRDADINDRGERLEYVGNVVGREVTSSAELTDDEARGVIEALKNYRPPVAPEGGQA